RRADRGLPAGLGAGRWRAQVRVGRLLGGIRARSGKQVRPSGSRDRLAGGADSMSPALKLAVVGHTNVGKTSLLRTLTRDSGFGEVSARPSTTREVQGARVLVDGEPALELFDTPGMEDPIGLMAIVEQDGGRRSDGVDRIRAFLESPAQRAAFEQEAK